MGWSDFQLGAFGSQFPSFSDNNRRTTFLYVFFFLSFSFSKQNKRFLRAEKSKLVPAFCDENAKKLKVEDQAHVFKNELEKLRFN